jgi:hypothetical protein
MFFRRPKSYSITLKRAHTLLDIPRKSQTCSSGDLTGSNGPSRDQILTAIRAAAKRHHPDIASSSKASISTRTELKGPGVKNICSTTTIDANKMFRECHEARDLLLDYYVRRKFIHPEVIQSTMNNPSKDDESFFSVWVENRSFQLEVFLRLSICLGLALGTYFHDKHMTERRRQQIRRRDEQFYNIGPQPRF